MPNFRDPLRPTRDPASEVTPRPSTLAAILIGLRQLALAALDAGHPMAAVQIAGTADRLEAEAWPLPPRPDYADPPVEG